MNWNASIRQIHRWLSVAFTVTVVANVVVLAKGGGAAPNGPTDGIGSPRRTLRFEVDGILE